MDERFGYAAANSLRAAGNDCCLTLQLQRLNPIRRHPRFSSLALRQTQGSTMATPTAALVVLLAAFRSQLLDWPFLLRP